MAHPTRVVDAPSCVRHRQLRRHRDLARPSTWQLGGAGVSAQPQSSHRTLTVQQGRWPCRAQHQPALEDAMANSVHLSIRSNYQARSTMAWAVAERRRICRRPLLLRALPRELLRVGLGDGRGSREAERPEGPGTGRRPPNTDPDNTGEGKSPRRSMLFLLGCPPVSAGRGIGDPDTRPSGLTSWHYLGAEPDGLVVHMTEQGAAAVDKARGRAGVPPGPASARGVVGRPRRRFSRVCRDRLTMGVISDGATSRSG